MPYAKGTCVTCGEPPEPDRSRCAKCLAARRVEDASARAKARKKRVCLTCGAAVESGRRYCRPHLDYYASRYASLNAKAKKRKR